MTERAKGGGTLDSAGGEAEAPTGQAPADDAPTLDTAVGGGAQTTTGPTMPPRPRLASTTRAQCIGRYVILARVGKGGMGVVYQAYDPELDRRVALKLVRLKTGPEGTVHDGRDRLLREAQALAQLSHPNVVSVYDVGVFESEVFIAMEYLEGRTLRKWLQEEEPSWQETLRVLLAAGHGLAAAHRAHIIHRDFKPENVIVGQDGRVRVLDFGLARITEGAPPPSDEASDGQSRDGDGASDEPTDEDASATNECLLVGGIATDAEAQETRLRVQLTEAGRLVGTPRYMAPEQHIGEETDERTDQFSYCATLYEALYGQRAFAGRGRKAIKREVMEGRVRDPPSGARVPARLRRVLLRGLAVAPEERYPSMDALLDELGRDPWILWRRAAAAVGVLVLVGLSLFGLLRSESSAQKCKGAGADLAVVWNSDARRMVKRAFHDSGRPYSAFTYDRVAAILAAYAEGWVQMSTDSCEATVRGKQSQALLDLRARCLDRLLAELGSLVTLFSRSVEPRLVDRAIEASLSLTPLAICADAEGLMAAVPLPADPATRERVEVLGKRIDRAKALEDAGDLETGLGEAAVVVAGAREIRYQPLLAEALYRLASLQRNAGDHKAARASLEEVVVVAARARRDDLTANAWVDLMAVTGFDQGRYEEGLALRRAAESALARAGERASSRASLLGNVANILRAQGKYEQARSHQRQAIEINEKVLGPRHPALATSYNNFGNVLFDMGEREEARNYYERALAIWEQALGRDHPNVAKGLTNLGNVLMAQKEYERALEHYDRAISIKESTLGPEHPELATSLTNMGETLKRQGRHRESIEYQQRALDIWKKARGERHPYTAVSIHNLGMLHYLEGRYPQARDFQQQALEIFLEALGPEHPYVAYALFGLGSAQASLGDLDDAIANLERAVEVREAHVADPALRAETRFALARALWSSGRDRGRALRLARDARDAYAAAGSSAEEELADVDAWLTARR